MVKIFFSLFLFFSFSFASEATQEDLLREKIKTFLDASVYRENKGYIEILFSPKSDYFTQDRVDAVKIVTTLKNNGLLNLFFKKPRELRLRFKTSGPPLLFVKIMGDTLRNIGYYRYVTQESHLDSSEFTWSISLVSEYATDPLILQKELQKNGCSIVDLQRNSMTDWTYTLDMRDGHLNLDSLKAGQEMALKKSLSAYWLNVSEVKTLQIQSSKSNDWYPYIAYYDSSLHLLEVVKKNEKTSKIILELPKYAEYIKISDMYTLKNIKDSLVVYPVGLR